MAAYMRDHPQRAFLSHLVRLAGLSVGMEIGVADGRVRVALLFPSTEDTPSYVPHHYARLRPESIHPRRKSRVRKGLAPEQLHLPSLDLPSSEAREAPLLFKIYL